VCMLCMVYYKRVVCVYVCVWCECVEHVVCVCMLCMVCYKRVVVCVCVWRVWGICVCMLCMRML